MWTAVVPINKHRVTGNVVISQGEFIPVLPCRRRAEWRYIAVLVLNTLRTGHLNCLNARSRGLTFRHRASCI